MQPSHLKHKIVWYATYGPIIEMNWDNWSIKFESALRFVANTRNSQNELMFLRNVKAFRSHISVKPQKNAHAVWILRAQTSYNLSTKIVNSMSAHRDFTFQLFHIIYPIYVSPMIQFWCSSLDPCLCSVHCSPCFANSTTCVRRKFNIALERNR